MKKFLFYWLFLTSSMITISPLVMVRFDSVFNFSIIGIFLIFSIVVLIFFNKMLIYNNKYIRLFFIYFILSILIILFRMAFEDSIEISFSETNLNSISRYRNYLIYLVYAGWVFYITFLFLTYFRFSLTELMYMMQVSILSYMLFFIIIYVLYMMNIDMVYYISTNQYWGYRGFSTGYGETFVRLGTSLPEPSFSAMYAVVFFPLILYKSKIRILLLIVFLIYFLLLKSKLLYLLFIMYSLFFLIKSFLQLDLKKLLFLIIMSVGAAGIIYMVYKDDLNSLYLTYIVDNSGAVSLWTRLGSMYIAILMFLDYPVFGVGFGQYPFYFNKYLNQFFFNDYGFNIPYPNNYYLAMMAENGSLSVLFFILLFILYKNIQNKIFKYSFVLFMVSFMSLGSYNNTFIWVELAIFTYVAVVNNKRKVRK